MAQNEEPAPTWPAALVRFVELFNRGDYWESHEVLEDPWRQNRSEFYHGLILSASCLVHARRGNPHGIRAQAAKAEAALRPYAPAYLGIDVAALRTSLHAAADNADRPQQIEAPHLTLDPHLHAGDEPELP